jgi:hypothetical protein
MSLLYIFIYYNNEFNFLGERHKIVHRKHLNPKHRPRPHNSYVLLEVKTPSIVPGQPALVEWSIYFPSSPTFDLGSTVAAEIYMLPTDTLVYRSSEIPYVTGDKLNKTVELSIPDFLYTFGSKTLFLEVTGDGVDPGPFIAEGSLVIRREIIDSTWWQWITPSSNNANWNEEYRLTGNLFNMSKWTKMKKADVKLSEYNKDYLDFISKAEETAHLLDPGSYESISFKDINQDWVWLKRPTYHLTGADLSKIFIYKSTFWFEDIYGNAYPEAWSTTVSFSVKISDGKIAAAIAAASAVVAAIGFAAAGIAAIAGIFTAGSAPGLFAAAAGFYVSAAASGEIAFDPPEPDPCFLDEVVVRPSILPSGLHTDGSLAKIKSLIEIMDRIFALIQALNQIHCRIIGAYQARNNDAVDMQKTSYVNIEHELGDYVRLLQKTYSQQSHQLIDYDYFPISLNVQLELLDIIQHGLAGDIIRSSLYSVPVSVVEGLVSLINEPLLYQKLITLNLSTEISCIISALNLLYQTIHKKMPEIFAGTTDIENKKDNI